MNSKLLHKSYEQNKASFHKYINNIKKSMKISLFSIVNPTLIINPYITNFPKKYFLNEKIVIKNKFILFIKHSAQFYRKIIFMYILYLMQYVLFKIYGSKSKYAVENTIINVTVLVNRVVENKCFSEEYFASLYEVFDKQGYKYTFLPKLYILSKNPFKMIEFFKIMKKDKRSFLFEYDLLRLLDLLKILIAIIKYPFKTLQLIQPEDTKEDMLFNQELLCDISNMSFEGFSRYFIGAGLAKIKNIKEIYSWSEFQVTERSFNYGIRKNSELIKITACQFFLNYETYFNTVVDDIDYEMRTSPHTVLVNGPYFLKNRKKVQYENGVALRYKKVFEYNKKSTNTNIVLFGSYVENDTRHMLHRVKNLKSILFKNHPAVNIDKYSNDIGANIIVVEDNIYKIFEDANLVISTASGSAVEAVACGMSVVIIASDNNLTANPLSEYGKGKIWDIAYDDDNIGTLIDNLEKYRLENTADIEKISLWYKNNFFIQPTEKNIFNAFAINKEKS